MTCLRIVSAILASAHAWSLQTQGWTHFINAFRPHRHRLSGERAPVHAALGREAGPKGARLSPPRPAAGCSRHQPKTLALGTASGDPAATPAQPAVEETINGGKAAESLARARKLALERASCESLPKEKQHLRLTKLYAEATQAIGASAAARARTSGSSMRSCKRTPRPPPAPERAFFSRPSAL